MQSSYHLLDDEEPNRERDYSIGSGRPLLIDVTESHRQMMDMAVKEAGRWSYGVKAVEVWQYTSEGRLKLVEGGAWVDPVYFQNEDPSIRHALEKLYNPFSPDFLDLNEVTPGEGLSGELWVHSFGSMVASAVQLSSENIQQQTKSNISWWNVRAIAEDPDQPYSNRTKVIAEAGFFYAAGVPFDVRGIKGVVVYMARESLNMKKVQSLLNVEYMLSVTDHIGSVLALCEPRKFSVEQRRLESRKALRKAKRLLRSSLTGSKPTLSEYQSDATLITDNTEERREKKKSACTQKLERVMNRKVAKMKLSWNEWCTKMNGGGIQPPPGVSLQLATFSWIVSFIGVFIIAAMGTMSKLHFGNDLGFELTQLGSMSTCIYALSAAPSAQPRTIMVGQTISMFIGIFCTRIPGGISWTGESFDCPWGWFRVALAISLSTALMSLVGCAHPPGGGLAIIMCSYNWAKKRSYEKILVLLVQDMVIILIAAILNNLNPAKSYPTYWGYFPNWVGSKIRICLGYKASTTERKASKTRLFVNSEFEQQEFYSYYENAEDFRPYSDLYI